MDQFYSMFVLTFLQYPIDMFSSYLQLVLQYYLVQAHIPKKKYYRLLGLLVSVCVLGSLAR